MGIKASYFTNKSIDLTLKIKYSTKYNRYFGDITFYGETNSLDSLTFNKETNNITFSAHRRNRDYFNLNVSDNIIKGTIKTDKKEFDIIGEKLDVFDPNTIQEYDKYTPTRIPDNITDLYLESGNKESNTVLLIVQGGPYDRMQNTTEFDKWKNKLHIIYVKQAQIINPTIFPPENNLDIEDARKENLVTVEMLHRVIKHFKSNNKKVLVWGASYGAWVIQKYIGEYGIGADAISIAAVRLEIEEEIWKTGNLNQTVYDVTYKGNERIYTKMGFSYTKPTSYLLATIDEERFTKTFENIDLSKLVVYQYGRKDGTVGRLNESEIKFLKSKNIEIEVCKKCYHRQMLSIKIANSAIEKMLNFISE